MKSDSISKLKDSKLKVTPARLAILNLFLDGCKPLNAENIYSEVNHADINLVTVYRTLASLEKARILKRIDLRAESIHYELADHHHHHIICTDCGTVESFETCEINDVSKKVLRRSAKFNSINQHSLELFGLCKSCSKT